MDIANLANENDQPRENVEKRVSRRRRNAEGKMKWSCGLVITQHKRSQRRPRHTTYTPEPVALQSALVPTSFWMLSPLALMLDGTYMVVQTLAIRQAAFAVFENKSRGVQRSLARSIQGCGGKKT